MPGHFASWAISAALCCSLWLFSRLPWSPAPSTAFHGDKRKFYSQQATEWAAAAAAWSRVGSRAKSGSSRPTMVSLPTLLPLLGATPAHDPRTHPPLSHPSSVEHSQMQVPVCGRWPRELAASPLWLKCFGPSGGNFQI